MNSNYAVWTIDKKTLVLFTMLQTNRGWVQGISY